MQKVILNKIKEYKEQRQKAFAVLLDPDKVQFDTFGMLLQSAQQHQVDFFFVGGSLLTHHVMDEVVARIKAETTIPVVIFPGSNLHITTKADALLFLSLISGRNPEFLIGQHVVAAPILKNSGLEILPTGYMLIDSGKPTTVSYISNTMPIPFDKPSVAACTAMAGEMLGLQLIYMDAGSGALKPISSEMIAAVKQTVDIPIIIGGGINTVEKAEAALLAGADIIVVGNAIEQNPQLLPAIANIVQAYCLTINC
jgi:phosphoglycerol geranylgeranyltransferase